MNAEQLSPPVIVVGVDGSDPSKDALVWAARQAELSGSALHVVTSWEFPAMGFWTGMALPDNYDFRGVSQKVVDQAIDETLGDHPAIQVSTVVVQGHPALELLGAARDADLLVVGSCGHGEFAGMLLGSVSGHCVAHSPCPVVVVPHGSPTA